MALQGKHISMAAGKPGSSEDKKISRQLARFYKNPQGAFGRKLMSVISREMKETLRNRKVTSVSWNKTGAGSHYNPKTGEIKIDPALVTSSDPTIMKFISWHEGGHRVITRYSELIPKVLKDVTEMKAIGYSSLCNAVEDPRDNNWGRREKPKAQGWQKKTYQPQFVEENAVMAAGAAKDVCQMLGYAPLFVQYQSELLRWWYTSTFEESGQYSQKLDPRVDELLKKTQEHFEQAYNILPQDRTEKEIVRTAEESFKIIHEKIWNNGYKELLEEVKDLDRLRQMMMDPKIAEKIWDSLPDELKKEIEKNIEEALAEIKKNGQKPEEGEGGFPIDPNKLSKELQKKLKELFDGLPQADKDKLKKRSDQRLGQAEDKLNDGYEGDLSEEKMPRHDEGEEIEEADGDAPAGESPDEAEPKQQPEVDTKKILDDLKAAEQKSKADQTNYSLTVVKYRQEIEQLAVKLKKIFHERTYPTHLYDLPEGEINVARIPDFYRDPSTIETLFMERRLPQNYEYCFSILVDLSGSMNGKNIEAAFDALVLICEALRRLKGIKLEIIGFKERAFMIKPYKKELGQASKELNSIIDSANGHDTNDLAALRLAYDNIQKQTADGKFILVLTDGMGQDLSGIMEKIKKEQKIAMPLGLGIGPGTDFVTESYTVSMPSIAIKDLPSQLAKVIKDMVEHPRKYQTDKKTVIKKTGQQLNLLEKRGDRS